MTPIFENNIHDFSMNYPPWSKSEALQLGVHLILLYFIRISLLSAEIFYLGVGVGGGLFLSLNLLKIKWYIV